MQASKLSHRKIVLVTGASSGFGKAIATLLAQEGLTVFGTSRNPHATSTNNFELLPLDVRGALIPSMLASKPLCSVPIA